MRRGSASELAMTQEGAVCRRVYSVGAGFGGATPLRPLACLAVTILDPGHVT